LVTGATGAIGKAIARQIAALGGYEVVLGVRDEEKARRVVEEIRAATREAAVRYELVDLSLKSSVRALAERWAGPLHVLVNNAGATPKRRQETAEGIEVQFATNVLAYFWTIELFADRLAASAPARIVNVVSHWAGDLDLADLQFTRRAYDNDTAYRQSKQAERMLTVAFAERLRPRGITVNACHPGEVSSKLSNNLGYAGSDSPDQGARTPVWLTTSSDVANDTGKFFADLRPVPDRLTRDPAAIATLYSLCARY
jgi:NAD(P)-dependent dehydrogenase (short-subunit alcohol dehydrogenase family)